MPIGLLWSLVRPCAHFQRLHLVGVDLGEPMFDRLGRTGDFPHCLFVTHLLSEARSLAQHSAHVFTPASDAEMVESQTASHDHQLPHHRGRRSARVFHTLPTRELSDVSRELPSTTLAAFFDLRAASKVF